MKTAVLLILVTSILFGCNFGPSTNPNALTEPLTIENKDVGWEIEVPAGWEMLSAEDSQESNERGYEAIKESMDLEIDASAMIQLLDIKKNETNILMVTAEPFFEEYIGEWNATNDYIQEILAVTYESQGFTPEISITETEQINGVEFMTYSIKISKPDQEIKINQTFFSSMHNGFDVSAALTYTDDVVRDEMLSIWRSSEFKVKEKTASEKGHYAKMDSDYALYISNADTSFDQEKYGEAIFWYEKATELSPLDEYPINQLEVCDEKADDKSYVQLELMQQYQKIVDKADALFSEQDYRSALGYYERALAFKPEARYPKDRVTLITGTILKMDYPEEWKPE